MEQNNYNPQSAPQQRDPLPTFPPQPQYNPDPNGGYGEQPPVYGQAPQPSYEIPEVTDCVNSAFGKGLAAVIMAGFPIVSILAIIFGSMALKLVNKANNIAAYYRVSAGGKNIAAKVLAKIGKIVGIVMTCFYGLYFLLLFLIIATAV